MPRTEAEIRAEDAILKGQGVHHSTKQRVNLRNELKAVLAANKQEANSVPGSDEAARIPTPQAQVHVEVDPGPGSISQSAPDAWSAFTTGTCSQTVFDSPEWNFIEKCIAEIKIDGQRTGRYKHLYQDLQMKVTVWRRIRRLTMEVGEGNTWPTFAELDMDAGTGETKSEMEARIGTDNGHEAPAEPEPTPEVPVRDGPDPQEVMAQAMGGAEEVGDMAKAIANELKQEFASRPKSEKPPIPTV